VLAAVTVVRQYRQPPLLPLTVEYREKAYAAGKIPGGFLKREAGPPTRNPFGPRDRPHDPAPLPERLPRTKFRSFIYVLSADQENDADVLGVTAASAALSMSKVPWNGPVAAVRVGRVEGAWILKPHVPASSSSLDVDMIVSGSKDSIVMVEGGALELTEAEIIKALESGAQGHSGVARRDG